MGAVVPVTVKHPCNLVNMVLARAPHLSATELHPPLPLAPSILTFPNPVFQMYSVTI